MSVVKIGIIQMDCHFGQVKDNVERAISLVNLSAEQGAKLICLPECFNVGYSINHLDEMIKHAERINGPTVRAMSDAANKLGVYIVTPFVMETNNGDFQNAAAFIDDKGKVIGTYAKSHLLEGEKEYFKRDADYPVFDTKYGKVGIQICYDLAHPEASRLLIEKGAQLILVPAAWRDKETYLLGFTTNLLCRAIDNVAFFAGANQCGLMDSVWFGGSSRIIDPVGHILAEGGRNEGVVNAEIDLDLVDKARSENSVLIDSHAEDFSFIASAMNRRNTSGREA